MFGISPANALWLVLALIFVWMLYRFQMKTKHYNLADIFMNHTTNPPKADLTSHIIFILMLMFVWACVERVNRDKDVDNLILGGLGIFVLRQIAAVGANAYVQKPAPPADPVDSPPSTTTVNVQQQPGNPLLRGAQQPVPVRVDNPEPIEVTQTPPSKHKPKSAMG